MNTYYIGSFPPPYGGVTIKNDNLYNALKNEIDIEKIDLSELKRKPFKLFRLFYIMSGRKNKFVVGVAGKNTRKRFSRLLYILNRNAMNRSILIVMGGTAAGDMAKDKSYGRYVKEFNKIYVETEGMKKTLTDAGICNVEIYPNGRFRPDENIAGGNSSEKLRCVFFSLICEEKGCNEILDAAKTLTDVDFVFYGMIEGSYEASFMNHVQALQNVKYKGVFSGSPAEVFKELSRYDVLLFPTRYKIEGVPGILVEAKISGLAIIASDESYNSEIVADGESGFIIPYNTAVELEFRCTFFIVINIVLYPPGFVVCSGKDLREAMLCLV